MNKDLATKRQEPLSRTQIGVDMDQLIISEFKKFINNTTNLKIMKDDDHTFFNPEVIIELFTIDMSKHIISIGEGHDMLLSPFARVLALGDIPNESAYKAYKKLRIGDIVLVKDEIIVQEENPNYAMYQDQKNRDDFQDDGMEPSPYVRKIWEWMLGGQLYDPDKMRIMTDSRLTSFDPVFVYNYKGPFVFRVPLFEMISRPKKAFGLPINRKFKLF